MRRDADVSTLCCPLTVRERDACDEIKARLGIGSDGNLVRTALYALGAHCEANIDTDLFRLRGQTKGNTWVNRQRVSKRQSRLNFHRASA